MVTGEAPSLVCRWKLQSGDLANTVSCRQTIEILTTLKDFSASPCELGCRPQPGDLRHLQRIGSTDFGLASAAGGPGSGGSFLGRTELCCLPWEALGTVAATAGAFS